MKRMNLVFVLALTTMSLSAQMTLNRPEAWITFHPTIENGVVGVFEHIYRAGDAADGNSTFNFKTQGGQELFSLFTRLSVDVRLGQQQTVTFLYQPLTLNTKTRVGSNDVPGTTLTIDGVTFSNDSPLDIQYGFDFWRVSWVWDFFPEDNIELAAGLSLQFRNASIFFESEKDNKISVSQNLGPVPILKGKAGYWWDNGVYVQAEVDGFYASSALFNGAEFPFVGYIWDAAARVGYDLNDFADVFLNFRLLGGGADGTSRSRTLWTESVSPKAFNHLSTYSITLGARLK